MAKRIINTEDERSCAIEIPLLPASVNHYTVHPAAGVHYKSQEAKGFEDTFGLFVRGAYAVSHSGFFAATLTFVLPPEKSGDVDNFNKQPLDCAAKARMLRDGRGKILSDARVKRLTVNLCDDEDSRQHGPLVRLEIQPIERQTWTGK